jgi:hypothetical protein
MLVFGGGAGGGGRVEGRVVRVAQSKGRDTEYFKLKK